MQSKNGMKIGTKKRVALGMSGGVDSSLSAVLLQDRGYEVTGVFLECWRAPGCRAEEDRKDALAIALTLGIPFQVLDFKDAYKTKVVEYFFSEYEKGRTPNPDVMCNKEIKFGLFYDWAMEHGFDAVATGHYARSVDGRLLRGVDAKKDQSYFLYLLEKSQLQHILFPVGHLTKVEVRALAEERGLETAKKPDSQGICFIGEINVHSFLKERLGEKRGEVVNAQGEVIGEHDGLWFYTIGQRHGFRLLGKIRAQNSEWKQVIPPFYVIAKDVAKNRLIVGFGEETLCDSFTIDEMHWIDESHIMNASELNAGEVFVRIRHGGKLFRCSVELEDGRNSLRVSLAEKIQGVADGQSAVLYFGEECLGGGVMRLNRKMRNIMS